MTFRIDELVTNLLLFVLVLTLWVVTLPPALYL